jgi:NAD(P)-dependent dehydrogenase (short-subunit alcohol dehydrogenase family)
MSFAGSVALVTGAGRGMGRVIAANFVAKGAKVALCDLLADRAESATAELRAKGGQVLGMAADIGREPDVVNLVARAKEQFGRIDFLINAAGGYGKSFRATHETPVEEWDMVLDSNLKGYFLMAKHVVPIMMAQQSGRIINFSSNAGRTVSPVLGASYTTAKAGVIGLTRHLSREYAKHGILVNTIAPGPTRGSRVMDQLCTPDQVAKLVADIPLGRLAEEQDITEVVMFLCSDASRFMTGAIVDVNGGYVLA